MTNKKIWYEIPDQNFDLEISGTLKIKWTCPRCEREQIKQIQLSKNYSHLETVPCKFDTCKQWSRLDILVEMNTNAHIGVEGLSLEEVRESAILTNSRLTNQMNPTKKAAEC